MFSNSRLFIFVVVYQVEGIEMTSKTLFAPTKINRDEWMSAIREASHYSEFQDMYDVGRILGRGHFSTVYVAKRRSDAQIFAVKVIDKTSLYVQKKNCYKCSNTQYSNSCRMIVIIVRSRFFESILFFKVVSLESHLFKQKPKQCY